MMNKYDNKKSASRPLWLAVDLGGTTAKLALFEQNELGLRQNDRILMPREVCRTVIPTRTEDCGKEIMADIARAAKELCAQAGIDPEEVSGAGIGVPGPVLSKTSEGYPVAGCVNLNWTGICYPGEELRQLTGFDHVYVCNDANAAALGELTFGGNDEDREASASINDAVMITLGTGIGGGIVHKRRVLTGAFGASGEVGHMPVSPDFLFLQKLVEKDPSIRLRADLEYYASASGIARIGRAALLAFDQGSSLREIPPEKLESRHIFDAAKEGDELALIIADFFFDTLGQGLAAVSSVIDPDLYIIGGGMAAAGDFLLDGLKSSYRNLVFHASRDTAFRLASLGNDAGLLGPIVPIMKHEL